MPSKGGLLRCIALVRFIVLSALICSSDKKYHPVFFMLLTSNFSLLIKTSAFLLFSSNLIKLIKSTLASFATLFFLFDIFFSLFFKIYKIDCCYNVL